MGPTKNEALRDEVLELEHIYHTVPVGLCLLSRDLRYLRINECLAEIHGRPVLDHIGRTVVELLPTLAPALEPLLRGVLETAAPLVNVDLKVTTPAQPGVERDWLASLYPLIGEDGTVRGISVVVHDIAARKRTEVALAKSEDRLRRLVESTNVIPWEADAKTWRFTYVGPQAVKILGYPLARWYEEAFWAAHIHEEDRARALEFCETSALSSSEYEFEYRMISSTGSIVWLHDLVCVESENGVPVKLRGFMFDVTERKQAEEALRRSTAALRRSHRQIQHLAGKLIVAQEEERKRVARELHDDVNQKLAALAITLSKMKMQLNPMDAVHGQITDLQRRTGELTDDVRRLSHRLHPDTMEHVGLVAALKSYCTEFSKNSGISVQISVPEDVEPVRPDVALCLYRVTQESLQNVRKHSGASEARVRLSETHQGLRLLISDGGVGFDVARGRASKGLGLVSMQERVRLVGGTFLLESGPGKGTELQVLVPTKGEV